MLQFPGVSAAHTAGWQSQFARIDFPNRLTHSNTILPPTASLKLLDFGRNWASLEQSDNPSAALVMAHLKTKTTASDPHDRKFWKLQIVKGLYSRGWTKPEIQQLIRVIDWMM
ncbi:MAG TPA: hypothetical protein VK137_12790, partial [Planctomycetaceae bacterium]|nr:hypothetical protein [Planctomycetaceae bacterium]